MYVYVGVVGSISCLSNAGTITVNRKYRQDQVPTVSFLATTSYLIDGDDFPYKILPNVVETFQGMVMQHLLCNFFRYNTFSIFAGDNFFGSKSSQLMADGYFCGIKPTSVHEVNSDGLSNEGLLAQAKLDGSRIFCLALGAGFEAAAADLIERGAAMGVFGVDTQLILPYQLIKGKFWRYFSSDADVALLMKGLLYVQYQPREMVQRYESGMAFYERWRSQEATQWSESECSQQRDDDDHYFLYRSEGESAVAGYTCAGLNFSSFAEDASDIAAYLGHAYDAANVLFRGVHAALDTYGNDFDGNDLMTAVLDSVEFDGATGPIDIIKGTTDRNGHAKGSREVGHIFIFENFDAALLESNGPDGVIFRPVIRWTVEEGSVLIDDIDYHSSDGRMVQDRLPDIVEEKFFAEKQAILLATGALCIAVSTFYLCMYIFNWGSKCLTSSQPRMSILILIGGYLVAGRVINAGFEITDVSCIVGLWLGHLGFALVFCTLFIKMWRVSALINAGMKKIRITEWYVVQLTLGAFGAMVVYMCILTWVGNPHADHRCETESNRRTCDMICSFDHPETHTVLFCVEAAMVCYGAYLCYRIKGAPAAVNESKYNAQGNSLM